MIKLMRINASHLKATINDIEYTWCGGLGCFLESIEKGLKIGDVRIFGDQFIYVWRIKKRIFRKPIIYWSIPNVNTDLLRDLKNSIFGV